MSSGKTCEELHIYWKCSGGTCAGAKMKQTLSLALWIENDARESRWVEMLVSVVSRTNLLGL
jgi:hypothetical protein